MDAAVTLRRGNLVAMPKLRKNKRIDNKWGFKYHVAVTEAVFGMQPVPYMPSEPPPSLSEDVSECEPLYVCKQCKDCFRFLTSYEDHNTRRSWILGYWCQHCFLTICTHVSNGAPPCPICQKLDRDKRSYLRTKGLKKSHKLGATRVFYNQCQFFAHLKTHNLTTVDMGDIMLMPLPAETINQWHPELDKACEALMEYSFLLRIHIADWLRAENIDKSWWKLVVSSESKDNPMSKILQNYEGRHFFPIKTNASKEDVVNLNFSNFMLNSNTKYRDPATSDIPYKTFVKEGNHSARGFETPTTDNNVSENEDNPCTPADIDFVDCGLIPQRYALESSSSSAKQRCETMYVKPDHLLLQDFQSANTHKMGYKCKTSKTIFPHESRSEKPFHCSNTTVMAKVDLKSTRKPSHEQHSWKNGKFKQQKKLKMLSDMTSESNAILTSKIAFNEVSTEKMPYTVHSNRSSVKKAKPCAKPAKEMQALRVTGMNSSSKILTFQSSKNVDINTIISQLSPRLLANKRIVLIGQDSEEATVSGKQESHSGKRNKVTSNLIHDRNGKLLSKTVVPIRSNTENRKNAGINTKKAQRGINDSTTQISLNAKVVYQNGRKYIIKHSHNVNRTASSPDLTKDIQMRTLTSDYCETPKRINDATLDSTTATQHNLSQSDVSLLTPSPSPSELSTSSSETHNKQAKSGPEVSKVSPSECKISTATSNKAGSESLSFHEDKNGQSYLSIQVSYEKPKLIGSDRNETMSEQRSEMIKNFDSLSCSELTERINHIQRVKIEFEAVVDVLEESTIVANLESIEHLEQELKDAMERHKDFDDASEGVSIDTDVFSNDWEQDHQNEKKLNCVACDKVVKPKSYVPGFSKPEKDDVYCSCYKCICHECCTYEGDSARFLAHQNFHKKKKLYACPDCCQKFISFKSLEIHTWTDCFHMMKKRLLGCKICNMNGFRDMESITRHYAIMHCRKHIVCDVCYLVGRSYAEYEKHCKDEHSSVSCNMIKVVVCQFDKCVVRCENYISHLERHTSITKLTWVKCPLCPFAAIEDKRTSVTCQTHLYSEHLHNLSSVIDPHVLLEILPSNLVKEIFVTNSLTLPDNAMSIINADVEYNEDDTVVPKIVNTRTIPSEVFESGAQAIDEDLRRDSGNSLATESTFQDDDEYSARFVNLNDTELSNIFESKGETSGAFISVAPSVLPKILDIRSATDVVINSSNSHLKDMKAKRITKNSSDAFRCQMDSSDQLPERSDKNANVNSNRNDIEPVFERTTVIQNFNHKKCSVGSKNTLKLDKDKLIILSPRIDKASPNCTPSLIKSNLVNENDANVTFKSTPLSVPKYQKTNTDSRLRVIDIDEINSLHVKENFGSSNCSTSVSDIPNCPLPLSKPPPLARIPQHILDVPAAKQESEEKIQKKHVIHRQSNNRKATNRKRQSRIALNGPTSLKEEPLDYVCHICGDMINTSWPIIRSHFTEKHAHDHKLCIVTPRLLRISPDFINGKYKEIYGNKKRKSENALSASKRRRRWTPKKYVDVTSTNAPGLGLCVKQESAEDADGNFKCKKCNQSCTDMSDLREHIASNHRIRGRYLVCLECGENFVVAPSLQMHLKAFHGIDDPVTYLSRNTSYAPEIIDDFDGEGKTTVANQCHVCMAVFEDKAAVDKHLRVHGMAFLNRKRIEARNAQISPEKKKKTEEDSPVKGDAKSRQSRTSDNFKGARTDDPAETILEKINATI